MSGNRGWWLIDLSSMRNPHSGMSKLLLPHFNQGAGLSGYIRRVVHISPGQVANQNSLTVMVADQMEALPFCCISLFTEMFECFLVWLSGVLWAQWTVWYTNAAGIKGFITRAALQVEHQPDMARVMVWLPLTCMFLCMYTFRLKLLLISSTVSEKTSLIKPRLILIYKYYS